MAQVDSKLGALLRLQLLARAQLVERACHLTSKARSSRRCACWSTTYAIQMRVDHSETALSLMVTRRGFPDGVGRGRAAGGTRSFVRRKESCWRGKKASIDHPCVRLMVRRRRVGGGARSRAMSHWMIGNIPFC